MANAEGDDDVEDAEPQDVDNEAREMNDWMATARPFTNCKDGIVSPANRWL